MYKGYHKQHNLQSVTFLSKSPRLFFRKDLLTNSINKNRINLVTLVIDRISLSIRQTIHPSSLVSNSPIIVTKNPISILVVIYIVPHILQFGLKQILAFPIFLAHNKSSFICAKRIWKKPLACKKLFLSQLAFVCVSVIVFSTHSSNWKELCLHLFIIWRLFLLCLLLFNLPF